MIRYEQRLASDTRTILYRFVCRSCGRLGTWLERADVVRENGAKHIAMHADESRTA